MATDRSNVEMYGDVDLDSAFDRAKSMYANTGKNSYPFDDALKTLTEAYGDEKIAKREILDTVHNPENKIDYSISYRLLNSPVAKAIESAPAKLREIGVPIPEPFKGDVADIPSHVVRQIQDTNLPITPFGLSKKAMNVIDLIPGINKPIVDEGRAKQIADVAQYVNPVGLAAKATGIKPLGDVASAMNEWVGEQGVGLLTPKNIALGAAMMTPAAPVAAALIAPQLKEGAVSGAETAYESAMRGDVAGATKGALDVLASLGMAKGVVEAGAGGATGSKAWRSARAAEDLAKRTAENEAAVRSAAESAAERDAIQSMLRESPRDVLSDASLSELAVKHGLIDAKTGSIVLPEAKRVIELAPPEQPAAPIPLGPSALRGSVDIADRTVSSIPERGRTVLEGPQEAPVDLAAIQDQLSAGTSRRLMEDPNRIVVTPQEAALRPSAKPVEVVSDMSTSQLLREALGERGSFSTERMSEAQLKFRERVREELAKRGIQAADIAARGAVAASKAGKKVEDVVPAQRELLSPSDSIVRELELTSKGKPAPSVQVAKDVGGTLLADVPRIISHIESQPGAVGAIGKEISLAKDIAMKGHAELQHAEIAQLSKVMDDLGVKSTGKKKLWGRLVQSLGEGELTPDQISKKYGSDMLAKVQAGERFFRGKYDEFLESMNKKRGEHGLPPIPREENYFRWIRENPMSDIQGLSDVFGEVNIADPLKKPSKKMGEQSIAKARGSKRPGKANAIAGYLDYLPQYANEMFNRDLKAKVDGAISDLNSLRGGDQTLLSGTHNALSDLSRRLVPERNPIDLVAEKYLGKFGKIALSVAQKVASKVNYSMVNTASSIVNNTAAIPVIAMKVPPSSMVRGAIKVISDMYRGVRKSDLGYFTRERYLDAAARKVQKGSVRGKFSIKQAFETYDEIITDFAWNSFFDDGLRKGLGEKEATRYADLEAGKAVGARARLDRPMFYESTIGKVLAPFTIEVNNLWNEMSSTIKGKGGLTGRQVAGRFLKYAIAAYFANNIIEKFTGVRPAFDPGAAIIDSYGIVKNKGEKETGDVVKDVAGRLGSELISAHAFGNLATSYFADKNTRNAIFGRNDPGKFGSSTLNRPFNQLGKVISGDNKAEDAAKLALMFYSKGGQIKKTYEGAKSLKEGGFKLGNRFVPIKYKGPVDAAKRLLFGVYPTEEMQNALKGK